MRNERITFLGAHGVDLSARLSLPPDGEVRACALFAHCFTCSKDLRAVRLISEALVAEGIATLRFDFTGLGESAGEFADTTFSSNVGDLVAAADWLRAQDEAPSLLVGHSLGGAAVLAAAHRIDEVRGVATIGAPADPAHVAKLFGPQTDAIRERGEAEVVLAGRSFRIRRELLEDLATQCSAERIAALGRALLIFHSPEDATVGIDNARKIYEAARHPKSFVSLDGADHLLSRARDATYVARVLATWAERYVERPSMPDTEGTVIVDGRRELRQQVMAGGHGFLADEPRRLGGTDMGPTPYDLLLAALGACTSMTLRVYADRKRWPLEAVRVTLSHTRHHAGDSAHADEPRRLEVIRRAIALDGDLDEEQRRRLMEIADRCPVHRTLHGDLRVETEVDET